MFASVAARYWDCEGQKSSYECLREAASGMPSAWSCHNACKHVELWTCNSRSPGSPQACARAACLTRSHCHIKTDGIRAPHHNLQGWLHNPRMHQGT